MHRWMIFSCRCYMLWSRMQSGFLFVQLKALGRAENWPYHFHMITQKGKFDIFMLTGWQFWNHPYSSVYKANHMELHSCFMMFHQLNLLHNVIEYRLKAQRNLKLFIVQFISVSQICSWKFALFVTDWWVTPTTPQYFAYVLSMLYSDLISY